MTTFSSKLKDASKVQIRTAMFNVELKLKTLRDTPYSGTAVDEEIDNDIVYWQKAHDELFVMFKN